MARRELLVCIDKERDPVKNMAREEELFQRFDRGELPELMRLWVNSECLVRGKARSPRYGWYNEGLARKMGIQVVTRETGGGVVYHDEGNLNWSFFLRASGAFLSPTVAFDRGSKYMVKALLSLGTPARFSAPNRIDVSDCKVSGMAAKSTTHTLLVHGTFLLNSNLDRLNLLCVPPEGCPPVANLNRWISNVDEGIVIKAVGGALEDSGFRPRLVNALE